MQTVLQTSIIEISLTLPLLTSATADNFKTIRFWKLD